MTLYIMWEGIMYVFVSPTPSNLCLCNVRESICCVAESWGLVHKNTYELISVF